MNTTLLQKPSVLAHILNGVLLMATLLIIQVGQRNIRGSGAQKLAMLVAVLSIAVGVHSLSHLGLEYVYGLDTQGFLRL